MKWADRMTKNDRFPRLSNTFLEAVKFAFDAHSQQTRKGTDNPYIGHPLHAAAIVLDAGGVEDLAIAALLHDVVEDQGGEPMLHQIQDKFGDRVAKIVKACSDSMGEPKPPWRERKERYIQHIASADADIRLVSAADKFSNAQAILADLRAMGDKLWDKFKAGKDDQLWYYRSLVDAFAQGPPDPRVTRVLHELRNVVEQIHALAKPDQ